MAEQPSTSWLRNDMTGIDLSWVSLLRNKFVAANDKYVKRKITLFFI